MKICVILVDEKIARSIVKKYQKKACDFLRRKGLCFWLMKICVILVDEKIGLPRPDFKKIAFCIFWFCLNLHKRHAEALHAKMPRNAVILAIFYQNDTF